MKKLIFTMLKSFRKKIPATPFAEQVTLCVIETPKNWVVDDTKHGYELRHRPTGLVIKLSANAARCEYRAFLCPWQGSPYQINEDLAEMIWQTAEARHTASVLADRAKWEKSVSDKIAAAALDYTEVTGNTE